MVLRDDERKEYPPAIPQYGDSHSRIEWFACCERGYVIVVGGEVQERGEVGEAEALGL